MLHQAIHPAAAPARVNLSGDVYGALINLSGRRRFTSQRIVLFAVLASMGHEGAIDTAYETLAQFREAHLTLIEGKGGMPGIFCEQLRDAYYGPFQGDKSIREFMELADACLHAIVAETPAAPSLLDKLVRSATPMLAVLNGLTLVYEEQSKRKAQQQRKQNQDMLANIKTIAKQARMVAFNAEIVAARAGTAGKDFSVVASVLSSITGELDDLVLGAMNNANAA